MKIFEFDVILIDGTECSVHGHGNTRRDARQNARSKLKIKQFLSWFSFIGYLCLFPFISTAQNWIEPIEPLVINDSIPDNVPSYYEKDSITYYTVNTFKIHPDTAQVKLDEFRVKFNSTSDKSLLYVYDKMIKFYQYIISCYMQYIDVTVWVDDQKYIVRYYKRPSGSELIKILE